MAVCAQCFQPWPQQVHDSGPSHSTIHSIISPAHVWLLWGQEEETREPHGSKWFCTSIMGPSFFPSCVVHMNRESGDIWNGAQPLWPCQKEVAAVPHVLPLCWCWLDFTQPYWHSFICFGLRNLDILKIRVLTQVSDRSTHARSGKACGSKEHTQFVSRNACTRTRSEISD